MTTITTVPDTTSSPRRVVGTSVIRRSLHISLSVVGALALSAALFGVTTGPASAATTTFTQSGDVFGGDGGLKFYGDTISVPADPQTTSVGPAAPYGSQILVPYDARVDDVNVELTLTHSAPDDLDLLLVGPGGQQALVMSDVGGSGDVTNLSFVIDDESANPLPDGASLQGSTYQPTNYSDGIPDDFALPAPAPTGNTSLAVFDGTIAAGTWRLFAMDDYVQDVGTISNWSLRLSLNPTPSPSTLDVGGLPPISDVDVVLHGLTSTYPDDMDVLLVSPGGQQAIVMSDAGGPNDVSDLTLTFDDEAANPPPDGGPLAAGPWRTVDYQPGMDVWGPTAPIANGNTALSAFDGISPNGQWRLFFGDDSAGDAGTISGWSLKFSFADTQSPSGSVNIDGGAATTSTGSVTLNVGASDPAPSNGVTQMRFSNDGSSWSPYRPYAATTAWTLAPGDGTKTVFAQFLDADGNASAVASDSIIVESAGEPADTVGPRSVNVSPAVGAKGVKTSSRVKVKAGERLRSGSVTGQRVFLKTKGSSQRVRATVAYVASSRTIVLTPRHRLGHRITYRFTIKSVRDLAGNPWDQKPGKAGAQALTYQFTTG
jgi:subtilisin-like proprotein convertase family protein